MAKVILSLDDVVLKEIPLTKERTTIGRKSHNDIHIDNLAVSGDHAVIETIMNDCIVEDLGSTNGTLVNGVLAKRTRAAQQRPDRARQVQAQVHGRCDGSCDGCSRAAAIRRPRPQWLFPPRHTHRPRSAPSLRRRWASGTIAVRRRERRRAQSSPVRTPDAISSS
jgi:hypothetical protein